MHGGGSKSGRIRFQVLGRRGGNVVEEERWYIPVRETAIDRSNPYQGKIRLFWGVGKPMAHDGAMYLGFAKVGRLGEGFIAESESWFLRSDNILTEPRSRQAPLGDFARG